VELGKSVTPLWLQSRPKMESENINGIPPKIQSSKNVAKVAVVTLSEGFLVNFYSTDYSLHWLLVKVFRPTRHKIGHFGAVPQANLLAWYRKTKPNTTKAHE